ncbi:MAG: glycerol-3-phosphate responsive antiterminator [Christensenellales bacterium]
MLHAYIEAIKDNPVIAAVQSRQALEYAFGLRMPTVFLLGTDIFSAKAFVSMVLAAQRNVFLHMDLIDGLAANAKALDYVKNRIGPSGIISTKSTLIKYAREKGIFCIQRFFMVDSASFDNAVKTVKKTKPSMVELMPGIIPHVIQRFTQAVDTPVIAGGLITRKEQIIEALSCGAIGVSTGNQSLWLE